MNAATCTTAVPASNSTDASPIGVKLWHVVAADSCGRRPTARNSGSRPPSQAPAASRCSASDTISCVPALPPIAPAWPSSGCTASAAPANTIGMAIPCAPEQRQYGDQQYQAQQQPVPELRLQRDRRHGMKRHRDAVRAGNPRRLPRARRPGEQGGQRAASARRRSSRAAALGRRQAAPRR